MSYWHQLVPGTWGTHWQHCRLCCWGGLSTCSSFSSSVMASMSLRRPSISCMVPRDCSRLRSWSRRSCHCFEMLFCLQRKRKKLPVWTKDFGQHWRILSACSFRRPKWTHTTLDIGVRGQVRNTKLVRNYYRNFDYHIDCHWLFKILTLFLRMFIKHPFVCYTAFAWYSERLGSNKHSLNGCLK